MNLRNVFIVVSKLGLPSDSNFELNQSQLWINRD